MAFWMRMPLALRREKWFYKKYVRGLTGEDSFPLEPRPSRVRALVKRLLAPVGLSRWGRGIDNDRLRDRHPRGCWGGIPDDCWKAVRREIDPDVTYWTNEALEEMRQLSQQQ
jgi:hypothetical protein